MRWSRGATSAAVLVAALALSACTGGSDTAKTLSISATPATPTTQATTTAAPPTSRPTTPSTTTQVSPTPTPSKTVPVDQIPPGNPTSWVPAGVPTTAKYREPGDVVPRFTPAMFKNTYSGALAVMAYYFDAVNWDAATGYTPRVFTILCPVACAQDARNSMSRLRRREHLSGGRLVALNPTVEPAPAHHDADWFGEFNVTVGAGKLIDEKGKQLKVFAQTKFRLARIHRRS
jgi:hypothetical protein